MSINSLLLSVVYQPGPVEQLIGHMNWWLNNDPVSFVAVLVVALVVGAIAWFFWALRF